MNPYTVSPDLNGEGLHLGIVRARFNEEIGQAELEACLAELAELGVDERDVMVVSVPGALELGVTLAQMAETFEFDALIALGAVIRGETYHFELVSNESGAAISRVSLETGIPVANGVLTTDTDEQAQARAAGKGRDCARVAVEMANLIAALEPETDDDDDDDEDEDFDEQE
ncbi:6,7-dimethyl-8-ribityllumazine synthase [Candidimonas humi]|jgi:6,7-dimethyl-8-ribityllumazine synthase|uniref:6,7-dimethyl-8-ribityllumazine synthase n=1 Tax=Candidimonas humi TaxID=683355 RepID=A0ABV8P128_9BURK|nr:6,7-dimethyl-8-ribityllumazine synthase [Candidimonas humi]MBV6306136.1 6,7-dimethyl-8-ribityllumazine synthase [Candidimonas humi]